ncbi:MAG: hypothetical protein ACTSPM_05580 [Candidatus Heimdallarchaeota archaeon]
MSHKNLDDMSSLNKGLLEKLSEAGYNTIESISWLNPEELVEAIKIDLETAQKIVKEAISNIDSKQFSAADLLLKEKQKLRISTGSNNLDELLGGGIYTGEITEISGEFATGKTQICFQLSVNVQLPAIQGGLEGSVYYIDTEGTFSSTRVAQIASERGFEPKKFLENIAVTL